VYRSLAELKIRTGDPQRALDYVLEWHGWQATSTPNAKQRLPFASGDESWLIYTALSDGFGVWHLHAERVDFRRLLVPPGQTGRLARKLLSLASDRASSSKEIHPVGQQLYDELLKPLEIEFARERCVTVVPDGELVGVPFQLLPLPTGKLLGQEAAIIQSTNIGVGKESPIVLARDAHALIAVVSRAKPMLGRELPRLPDAEHEGSSVAAYFPDHTSLNEGAVVTSGIQSGAPRCELFHFAGHGYSNAGNGGLLLAADEAPLASPAIATMDWGRCRLVVLSACLTATGEFQGSVNPQSLVRAFLMGGAQRVIASSWAVDSTATRQLFENFYPILLSGKPAQFALQQAEQRIQNNPRFAHPYYWAAFQLYR
jgi:CHAT domain-containing protein